jgi:hypothetical protein
MSNSKLALTISPTQFGALEAGHKPGSARRIRRMGCLRVPVRRLRRRSLGSPQHPPGGPLRARPDFPEPAALAAGANPATRDAFKRATESRAALLACAASFLLAILDSVGEANRLVISDPLTDTLHLTPRGVIIAMTALHGVMTGAEVDALRQPLKKKLSAVSDLPSHIVTFRGVLARLANAEQATLPFNVYRLFLATLTPFPVFQQLYTLLFTVANGAIAQQTFETYAAYILPQLHNILAHSNPRPFAGNLEGYGGGASEDDVMEGDLIYPPQPYPQYPTANTVQPYYPTPTLQPQNILPPPPGTPYHYPYYPMANGYQYPYTPPAPAPAPSDKKGNRQQGKKQGKKGQHQPKEKTGTPNLNLPRTSYLPHPPF